MKDLLKRSTISILKDIFTCTVAVIIGWILFIKVFVPDVNHQKDCLFDKVIDHSLFEVNEAVSFARAVCEDSGGLDQASLVDPAWSAVCGDGLVVDLSDYYEAHKELLPKPQQ